MADDNEQVEVSTDEARAGSTPHMTRYILGISLVLIVVIFAALLLARQ
jgi:hypothetical protein